MGDMTCAEVRELTPELALGIVCGQERDDALRHVDGCEGCRLELDSFTRVGDELLRMAPPAEPPSGFEERVLDRMRPVRHAGRRWWAVAVAAAVALIVGAASMYAVGARDRGLAREYGEALGTLHGTSLRGGALRDNANDVDGQVALYDGHPSWIFVAVERGTASGDATIALVGSSTRTISGLHLVKGHGALGSVVSGDVTHVRTVQVRDGSGRVLLSATITRHRD